MDSYVENNKSQRGNHGIDYLNKYMHFLVFPYVVDLQFLALIATYMYLHCYNYNCSS